MKLYGACDICKRKAFFVRKRMIKMPQIGLPITSQKEMCGACIRGIELALKINKDGQA